jgi:hypothetical protein
MRHTANKSVFAEVTEPVEIKGFAALFRIGYTDFERIPERHFPE